MPDFVRPYAVDEQNELLFFFLILHLLEDPPGIIYLVPKESSALVLRSGYSGRGGRIVLWRMFVRLLQPVYNIFIAVSRSQIRN